jgi:ubiquinone biosynthesis UbiH/UbiF/VisC/COQ6 family hydroxylase
VRAYALNSESVALLRELKVWDALPSSKRCAVYDMAVQGDAAGSLAFSAWQQTVRELAYIVDAAALDAELGAALRYAPHVHTVHHDVPAALLVLAEGRDAQSRSALGVQFELHHYGQRAIAARLRTDRPHAGVARQWFRSPDVLALLPLDEPAAGLGYGLVWSLPTERAQALAAMDEAAFLAELQAATGPEVGTLALTSARASWPLALGRADRVCGAGWALVGDAAHVIHPLAGQGLNLGLADVACLVRVIAAREAWRGLGDERLLQRYARERSGPTLAMATLTDSLLRLFANESPWARELRNRGMALVNQAAPLKRWLVGKALGV